MITYVLASLSTGALILIVFGVLLFIIATLVLFRRDPSLTRSALEALKRKFIALGTFGIFLIGCGLLILPNCFANYPLIREFVRDLGIAAVVSSLINTFIESQAAKRREEEAKRREQEAMADALDRFVGRIIPINVWQDFRTKILAEEVVCESWDLDVFMTKQKLPEYEEEQYVSFGNLTYVLSNRRNSSHSIEIRHELEDDIKGTDEDGLEVPRFMQLTCIPKTGGESKSWDVQALKQYQQGAMLKVPYDLPAMGSISIGLKRRELLPVPGGFPWYFFWITLKCKITIQTDVKGLTFKLLKRHHDHKSFYSIIDGESWSFEGVMLPGQGFEVVMSQTPQGILRQKYPASETFEAHDIPQNET